MGEDNKKRIEFYKKDEFLERYLSKINDALIPVDKEMLNEIHTSEFFPPIFIVGVQRSGTTLLNQLVINHFKIAYPTNFLARFWKAPLTGALLSKSLNLNNEDLDYNSTLGYTKGLNGPHEFGYFWNYWFPFDTYDKEFFQNRQNDQDLVNQINHLMAFYQKPIVFKNLHKISFNIDLLSRLFPSAIFLNVERDPIFVAQSTYESRLKLFASEKEWFGIKPPQYLALQKENPIRQIVGQIYHSRKYITDSLRKMPESRQITIYYEELIDNPKKVLNDIGQVFRLNGLAIEKEGGEELSLNSTNIFRLDQRLIKSFQNEIKAVFNE